MLYEFDDQFKLNIIVIHVYYFVHPFKTSLCCVVVQWALSTGSQFKMATGNLLIVGKEAVSSRLTVLALVMQRGA